MWLGGPLASTFSPNGKSGSWSAWWQSLYLRLLQLRPEFSINGWRDLGSTGNPAIESAPQRAIGNPVKTPSASEELDDDIPF